MNAFVRFNLPARVTLFVVSLVVLTACAPTSPQRSFQAGTSVILASVEVFPDFTTSPLVRSPSDIYALKLQLAGSSRNREVIRATPLVENPGTQSRWLAFPVPPGVYGLAGVIEEGNDGLFTYNAPVKTTSFNAPGEMPLFEVGQNEVLYIGSNKVQLGTKYGDGLGQLGGRVLRDARKSYDLDTERAQQAIRRYRLSDKKLREVNIFSRSPGAFEKYKALWSTRPTDHERVADPVDRDEIIKRANEGLQHVGEQ